MLNTKNNNACQKKDSKDRRTERYMVTDQLVPVVVSAIISIGQVLLGSISVYSIFNDAIIAGFACMILLYMLGFVKSHTMKKAHC